MALWEVNDWNGDAYGKFFQDKFKINMKTIQLSWNEWTNQLNTLAAAQDLPNYIATYGFNFQYNDQGLLRSIPDDMMAKYPELKKMIDGSVYASAVNEMLGGYYYIPRPESLTGLFKAQKTYVYYRQDWMKNVGITKVPETVEEYYQLLKAFKEKDPDQNGLDDTVGLTIVGTNKDAYPLFPMFGIDPSKWVKEDGKWIPGYMSSLNIEPLKYYQKLFREKLLDPEFLQLSYNDAISRLAQGKAGSMHRDGDSAWLNNTFKAFKEANANTDPMEALAILPPLKKDENSAPSVKQDISDGGTMISANTSDEQLDRLLEMLNWMLTDEGQRVKFYGLEGVDFKVEDGKVTRLVDDEELNKKYPSKNPISFMNDWSIDVDEGVSTVKASVIPQEYIALSTTAREQYNAAARQDNLIANLIVTPAKMELAINWVDSFAQIIGGKEDAETAFKKLTEEWATKKGVNKAIEEVTAEANKRGL
ncbi:extracellular solute-binding protein [Cohnella panacarvi]|uniref:extracellular solute-binding protein n=1 Tax=Cohnella panacarvi TaxID=400776 RepID=UPI00047E5211|nr:extracellular solute-binding protein [Cohnella panacarvi]